ncbi:hypothetical protein TWF103_003701 [Orbilia oligospora]|uniref:Uncharacterized protein n=1 Tax=Orbilia oligospora TaxID=2813651 RepID=A0A7C8NTE2_ORBOL|nr:hypothetical protein TWF103_003701 [Orbilia oligospora]KAF3140992.1 hypothetical protein TWF703_002499 [Orbilia oligospora]
MPTNPLWHNLLLPLLLLTSSPVYSFRIEFGTGSSPSKKFELLQPPAIYPPTDETCHEITTTLSPGSGLDLIRVQSNRPNDGDPAGILAFYNNLEECQESNPMYISWFKPNTRSIQAASPYWTIIRLGELKGDWTLGRTGYPEPRAWRNIPQRGVSPEIGVVRRLKLKSGDVAMLFDEGWGVDAGGVVWEAGDEDERSLRPPQGLQNINGVLSQRKPSYQTQQSDGTEIFVYPDGSRKAVIPDGPVVDTRPDGTATIHQDGPDGFIAEYNPRTGALVQDNEGRHIRLNLEELEELDALEAAGVFKSRTAFNEAMLDLQSSLFSPNSGAYDALSRLNPSGDFVAEDIGSPMEQDDSPQPRDSVSLPELNKGKKFLQKIGSALKKAYNWARRSCKLRPRKSLRSPVLPECAADMEFMRENEFSPFSLGSPSASASYLGDQPNGQRLSRFNQGKTIETPNGAEQSFKHTFSPVPDGTDGDFTEENLESPYFAQVPGNEFTFRDEENSRRSEDVGDQEPDEVLQFPNQVQDYSLGILNILNRKKDTSEFTFKGEQQGTQSANEIYTEGTVASYPELNDIEEDVVVQDISRASSS